MNEQELLQSGIGRKLVFLGRAADMISISLSPTQECPYDFVIHIMTYGEIFLDRSLLTSTTEIFEQAHSSTSKYDEKIAELLKSEKVFYLHHISYDSNNCLHAEFSNGLGIHSRSTKYISQIEKRLWRVFLRWKAENQLVATENDVYMEKCNETQTELDRMRSVLQHARQTRGNQEQPNQGTVQSNQGTVL